mgnify:CR=1 FL=1
MGTPAEYMIEIDKYNHAVWIPCTLLQENLDTKICQILFFDYHYLQMKKLWIGRGLVR